MKESPSGNEAAGVVWVAEKVADHSPAAGSVSEFSIAQIDTAVGYAGTGCIKEHEVSVSEIASANLFSGGCLSGSPSWNLNIYGPVNGLCEARAVYTVL